MPLSFPNRCKSHTHSFVGPLPCACGSSAVSPRLLGRFHPLFAMLPVVLVLVFLHAHSVRVTSQMILNNNDSTNSSIHPGLSGLYTKKHRLLVKSEPPNDEWRQRLIDQHNMYRSQVPATNMMMLLWDDKLAKTAQKHADRCDFRHSRDRVTTGENIWTAPYANYGNAVRLWHDEVYSSICHCMHAYKHCCGHYVQVVWADTQRLGCGFSRCRDVQGTVRKGHRNVLVCHYFPRGNAIYPLNGGGFYALPAFKWANKMKHPCSECPRSAGDCFNGLCYRKTDSSK